MAVNEVRSLLESRIPGLHADIEQTLIDAEARFNGRQGQGATEFVLNHTRRAAAIALRIASSEGVDPLVPALVALFHDAGKFHEGEYHRDDVPEEEHAAVLAERMLTQYRLPRGEIDEVLEALRALYDDRRPLGVACRVVQDADRLDKLGALGIGAYFTKAALRGRGAFAELARSASRELTYARAAPRSMFTETGRRFAVDQSARTVAYFDALLAELEQWGIASLQTRVVELEGEFRTRTGGLVQRLEVTLVMPRVCPECEGALSLTHRRARGLKCDRLTSRFACGSCDYTEETAFCLPVFA